MTIDRAESIQLSGVLDRIAAIRKELPPTAGRIADFIVAKVIGKHRRLQGGCGPGGRR